MPEAPTKERVVEKPPFGAPSVFVLAIVNGADSAAVHRIGKSQTVIGRSPDSDFVVTDEEVSKKHCRLLVDGSTCNVKDLESRNGTVVNGRPLRAGVSERLRHLDEIQVGDTRMVLLTGRFREQPKKV